MQNGLSRCKVAIKVKTLICDPIYGSSTGSAIPGILQAYSPYTDPYTAPIQTNIQPIYTPYKGHIHTIHSPYTDPYTAPAVAKSLQSCPTLCDPTDSSTTGSAIPGILQARTLEWVAISFSRGSSQPRDRTLVSCIGRQILYH